MPQIAWKWLRAAHAGSKKPLTRRKTPVLQGGNRSTARRLKEPFAHHKLHPVNNSPALTDQSRPVVSAKYMEIINPFSKPGLSCMCQTRSSKDSWYVNLNNLSSRKMQLTLNLSSSENNQISSQWKSRLNLFSLHPGGHKTYGGIPFCWLVRVPLKDESWIAACSLLNRLLHLTKYPDKHLQPADEKSWEVQSRERAGCCFSVLRKQRVH